MPISRVSLPGVIEMPGYIMAPTGAKVFYVHSSGVQSEDDAPIADRLYTTLNAALLACRSARGDVVLVLPGHAESFSAADSLSGLGTKTGITVMGLGEGDARPTFTWTAAGSTVLFDAASFAIKNCRLLLAGADAAGSALTVAAPITVSAPGCAIEDCYIRFGFDADQIVTVGITTTAAADRFKFNRNHCTGATAAECTTFMDIIGVDYLEMKDNHIAGATSSTTVGIVRFATTASLDINLQNNFYANRKAASVHAVTGLAGVTGISRDELFHMLDNAATLPWGTSNGSMAFYNARNVNLAGENGMISTLVST